ncbi:MAG: DUF429 domain-containing protein, partial [Alphaproteobacteria bacterium]
MVSIVGLDLAGVETRPSGFCLLNENFVETSHLYSDKEIIKKTIDANAAIIAIDAPLYLPPGRTSLQDRAGPHLRESDRVLIKKGIKIFPATLGPMRKLTARGVFLRGVFEDVNLKVIEAYPGGAQDILHIPRKQKGLDKLLAGLQALGIMGLTCLMSDHELDD